MNKNIKTIFSITAAAAFALGTAYSVAGGKGSNVSTDKKGDGKTSVVAQLALAEQLTVYGDQNKEPMALVLAAKIKKANPDSEKKREKKTEGSGKDDKKADKGADNVDAILARAQGMANGDKTVIAMIDSVKDMESARGRSEGAATHRDRVLARDTDTYALKFNGGERAAVLVNGDHDTDLDLYIYDENGNSICNDQDSTDVMFCEWYPKWTGTFYVKIKNRGSISNIYSLRTN